MGGLVFRSSGRNMSFKDAIYTNGKNFGTHHLCLRTGTGANDVLKYGLTSNRTASGYCPMKLRVDGKDAYIGKASTSGTYRDIYSQYTSRQVDVTYSSTSSGGGSYTYARNTTYQGPSSTETFSSTYTGAGVGMPVLSTSVGSTTYMSGHSHRTSTAFTILPTGYTSTMVNGRVTSTTTGGQSSTTVLEVVDIILTSTVQETYHYYPPTTVTYTSTWAHAVGGVLYTTTIQSSGYQTGSGTYSGVSYTYKDDGYNTWYVTRTSTDYGNINM